VRSWQVSWRLHEGFGSHHTLDRLDWRDWFVIAAFPPAAALPQAIPAQKEMKCLAALLLLLSGLGRL
jgi:hypothetical protein